MHCCMEQLVMPCTNFYDATNTFLFYFYVVLFLVASSVTFATVHDAKQKYQNTKLMNLVVHH